jgi:quinol-cytochrome oxidoreductase complex cytochrome b subunit
VAVVPLSHHHVEISLLFLEWQGILNFNEQDIMKFTNNEANSDKSVWFICDKVHRTALTAVIMFILVGLLIWLPAKTGTRYLSPWFTLLK